MLARMSARFCALIGASWKWITRRFTENEVEASRELGESAPYDDLYDPYETPDSIPKRLKLIEHRLEDIMSAIQSSKLELEYLNSKLETKHNARLNLILIGVIVLVIKACG